MENPDLIEKQRQSFVSWFRNSAPYIRAHQKRTFIISFGGEAVADPDFACIIHDIALLNSLGIKLVIVHGIRPQIDERLRKLKITPRFHQQLRITDTTALQCVKEAAGLVRVEIEALLSMGLSNSPMSGAKIRVSPGNYITAKPIGVIDGVDYCHTGEVRRIDSIGINHQLEQGHIVLISPIGYSPSGETFNLSAEKVATEIAISLQAEKLILMTEPDCNIAQMTTAEAKAFIDREPSMDINLKRPLKAAIHGCNSGVKRVHLLHRRKDGALLIELFTRNGVGTLISSNPYEELRPAKVSDISGILNLIRPLEEQGVLVKRSRERLETEISDYIVIEIDGLVAGCAAMHLIPGTEQALLACITIHPDYRHASRGNKLLEFLYGQARKKSISGLYVLSTQTMHWFLEHGFKSVSASRLPNNLKSVYNPDRNSKSLFKTIT